MSTNADRREHLREITRLGEEMRGAGMSANSYRRRPWWRRHTIQSYRVWKLAYRLGLTKEPW